MIDFACKQFNFKEIVKCAFGLTKAECSVLEFFMENMGVGYTTDVLSEKLKLNLTTIQKATKKLSEKNIVVKKQKNLDRGGYVYCYTTNDKSIIQQELKNIIKTWSNKVEENIDAW